MSDDPRTSQPARFPAEQLQPSPGVEADMRTKPDHGEETYVGKGLLGVDSVEKGAVAAGLK